MRDDSTEIKKKYAHYTTVDEVRNDRMFTYDGFAYGNVMPIYWACSIQFSIVYPKCIDSRIRAIVYHAYCRLHFIYV